MSGLEKTLENLALWLGKSAAYAFISVWFGFMLTYLAFKASPFFLFLTWENFAIFYVSVALLSLGAYFWVGPVISFLKRHSS